jgi:hypothetical protein
MDPLVYLSTDCSFHLSIRISSIRDTESVGKLQITNKGFQFLLRETYQQVWTLLLHYIYRLEVGEKP